MDGTELKVVREGLGLSTRWLSERWAVREQSVQRWESRNYQVPTECADDLIDILRQFSTDVTETIASLGAVKTGQEKLLLPKTDEFLVASDSFPASFYRAVAFQVLVAVPEAQFGWRGEEED